MKVEQWTSGRGPPGLQQALDQLSFGETGRAVTESDIFVVIPSVWIRARRRPPSPPMFELPTVSGPKPSGAHPGE